ncbi:MAG: VOC family protein [Devosia sp.]|nr:VOC family protein [Devosia sp.]
MLTSNEIMAFLATANPGEAIMFYRDRLGLRLVADTEFALEFEAGDQPTPLRVQKVPAVAPAPYTVLGWRVGNIEEEVDALAKRGIGFSRFEGLAQDARGIWTAPDGTRVAWFKDPDGNLLSLTRPVPGAATSESTQPIT